MMKPFFKVCDIDQVLAHARIPVVMGDESIPIYEACGRIAAKTIAAHEDLPGFPRATMDGFALKAASTFGASEANPAFLSITGAVEMGIAPAMAVALGEAVRIATGAMLPEGADAVVMIEHAELIDDRSVEVYRSVAPGQHVIRRGEDYMTGAVLVEKGRDIRPQEAGLLAAFGHCRVQVFKKPGIGIISTGDEIVDMAQQPGPGKIRDVNAVTLSGLIGQAGGIPVRYGIVGDTHAALARRCEKALSETDMVLISGGSSVGMRDMTVEVISALSGGTILAHGISISPGKPTVVAMVAGKPVFGLPGHVVSAMVVFEVVVKPFINHLRGRRADAVYPPAVLARLARNVSKKSGRTEFVRVKLRQADGGEWVADPVLGKSGLINTMVKADGWIRIEKNDEGLDPGSWVNVHVWPAG